MSDRNIPEFVNLKSSLSNIIPWRKLASFPTPIRKLCFDNVNIWIKRDDLSSESFSGTKIRKLEFILAQAEENGFSNIVTIGGIGSNHCLITARACKQLGLGCTLLLFEQPLNSFVMHNLTEMAKTGVELVLIDAPLESNSFITTIHRIVKQRNAFFIPIGGSSPIGTIGIVDAVFELRNQINEGLLPCPNTIYCANGSGGTVAGIALGVCLAGLNIKIAGVNVGTIPGLNPMFSKDISLCQLISKTQRYLNKLAPDVFSESIIVPMPMLIPDYEGKEYGSIDCINFSLINKLKSISDIDLDPVYTIKAFRAVIDNFNFRDSDEFVLFWLTGKGYSYVNKINTEINLPPSFQKFMIAYENRLLLQDANL